MKSIIFLCFCLISLVQCKNNATSGAAQKPEVNNHETKSFGAAITEEGSVTPEKAAAMLANADSMAMKITGKVTEVCQARGCWMNVVDDQGGQPIFVQFKDYGFFMPKDCSGKKVTMDGMLYKQITPVEELRHYAQDKGATKDEIAAITQPKEELKFMAKGVVMHENN